MKKKIETHEDTKIRKLAIFAIKRLLHMDKKTNITQYNTNAVFLLLSLLNTYCCKNKYKISKEHLTTRTQYMCSVIEYLIWNRGGKIAEEGYTETNLWNDIATALYNVVNNNNITTSIKLATFKILKNILDKTIKQDIEICKIFVDASKKLERKQQKLFLSCLDPKVINNLLGNTTTKDKKNNIIDFLQGYIDTFRQDKWSQSKNYLKFIKQDGGVVARLYNHEAFDIIELDISEFVDKSPTVEEFYKGNENEKIMLGLINSNFSDYDKRKMKKHIEQADELFDFALLENEGDPEFEKKQNEMIKNANIKFITKKLIENDCNDFQENDIGNLQNAIIQSEAQDILLEVKSNIDNTCNEPQAVENIDIAKTRLKGICEFLYFYLLFMENVLKVNAKNEISNLKLDKTIYHQSSKEDIDNLIKNTLQHTTTDDKMIEIHKQKRQTKKYVLAYGGREQQTITAQEFLNMYYDNKTNRVEDVIVKGKVIIKKQCYFYQTYLKNIDFEDEVIIQTTKETLSIVNCIFKKDFTININKKRANIVLDHNAFCKNFIIHNTVMHTLCFYGSNTMQNVITQNSIIHNMLPPYNSKDTDYYNKNFIINNVTLGAESSFVDIFAYKNNLKFYNVFLGSRIHAGVEYKSEYLKSFMEFTFIRRYSGTPSYERRYAVVKLFNDKCYVVGGSYYLLNNVDEFENNEEFSIIQYCTKLLNEPQAVENTEAPQEKNEEEAPHKIENNITETDDKIIYDDIEEPELENNTTQNTDLTEDEVKQLEELYKLKAIMLEQVKNNPVTQKTIDELQEIIDAIDDKDPEANIGGEVIIKDEFISVLNYAIAKQQQAVENQKNAIQENKEKSSVEQQKEKKSNRLLLTKKEEAIMYLKQDFDKYIKKVHTRLREDADFVKTMFEINPLCDRKYIGNHLRQNTSFLLKLEVMLLASGKNYNSVSF